MFTFVKKYSCIVLISSTLFLSAVPVSAKITLLGLDESIAIALEKSYEMKSLRLQLTQAGENLSAAKGRFRTNASLNMSIPYWSEEVNEIPVQNALPVFNTTGTLRYEGTFEIRQPLPTDGTFWLSSHAYHRDVSTYLSEVSSNIKRRDFYSSISLHFEQPIFTMNKLQTGLKRANLNYERSARRFKQSELALVYDVTDAFFRLYRATRSVKIATDDVTQQQELYTIALKKFQAGLIPQVSALQMEVDLAESKNNLMTSNGELARARDSYIQLIGLQFSDSVGVQTDFEIKNIEVDLDKAIEYGLKYRSEIRENEIDVELAKLNIRETDARSAITGNLWAFYDLTGISDPNLPYNSKPRQLWNSSLDDMSRRPNNRGLGFTLSVPIFDWGVNAAEVQAAKADFNDSQLTLEEQKKTIVREVRNVVNNLKEAEGRLEVLQKRQEVAEKAFAITLKRFNTGDITSQELALDRERFIAAKMAFLDAYIFYKLAIANLKQSTMWDFENNTSVLDEKMK
jgi:outer membrane protein